MNSLFSRLFLFLYRTMKQAAMYPTKKASKITQVAITLDLDSFLNYQFSFLFIKIYVTIENDKSINAPVTYIRTVLNFKFLKIFFIISLTFSLKDGMINRAVNIKSKIIVNRIINKYWLIFTMILSEEIPELWRLLKTTWEL